MDSFNWDLSLWEPTIERMDLMFKILPRKTEDMAIYPLELRFDKTVSEVEGRREEAVEGRGQVGGEGGGRKVERRKREDEEAGRAESK